MKTNNTNIFELMPTTSQNQKSFYGKAIVMFDNGTRTLFSYGTRIITENSDGTYTRHYNGWTMTTGKHIKAFCGMNKAEFLAVKEV